jgi:selenocysteine-specific elongation factor
MTILAQHDHVTKSVIVGTAGHIDHGKTALVYALTGTDTDRLPEEKRRGITIDLGFAAMRLRDENDRLIQLSLIDVPGHHAFVRNMLAGAGGIDCVLLVIAADEGVKAQTREHLTICSLLGIEHGLVVLTKIDAVGVDRLEQSKEDAAAWLRGTFLQNAPVLAVSAKTGEGLTELCEALARLATTVPVRTHDFVPRLPCDRSFSMHGFGTITTGTLQSGAIHVSSTLELQPGGRTVRVRGIQVHRENVEVASAPCRVALNLPGIEASEIHRGHTLVPPGVLAAVRVVDAEISLLPDAPELKHRTRVRVHAFAADISATVLLYGTEPARGGGTAIVRLQLENSQVLVPGDRFVLRQSSPAATIGGGRVLDIVCGRGLKKAQMLLWLLQIRNADREQQFDLRLSRRDAAGATIDELVRETGLCAEAIRKSIDALVQRGSVVVSDARAQFVVSAKALTNSEAAILRQVSTAKNGSISRAELRSRTKLNESTLELALSRLIERRRLQGGEILSQFGTARVVNEAEQQRAWAVEQEYAAAGIAPPLLREVSERLRFSPSEMYSAVTMLLRTKKLIRLGADNLYIHCEAVARLRTDLLGHRGESFDVTRFKTFTGLTRKHAIPLLEYLDRTHVTRNVAGTHIVL